MHVVGAHIRERASPLVFELDAPHAPGARSEVGMAAGERLELGLLVS